MSDCPPHWTNLVGTDGKVKARLNRLTGELIIRERHVEHRWNVADLCGRVTVETAREIIRQAGEPMEHQIAR